MRFLLIFFFLLQHLSDATFAQVSWKAVYSSPVVDTVLYELQVEKGPWEQGLYFPEYDGFPPLQTGLRVSRRIPKRKLTESGHNVNALGWETSFQSAIACKPRTTMVLHRAFLQNVASYTISFFSKERCFSKRFDVEFDGYQLPEIEYLVKWGLEGAQIAVTKARIAVVPKDPREKSVFILGDLKMVGVHYEQVEVSHPFFAQLFGVKEAVLTEPRPLPAISAYNDETFMFSYGEKLRTYLRPTVNLLQLDTTLMEPKLFVKTLALAIDAYPFYEERQLSKLEIIKRFNQEVVEMNGAPCDYCDLALVAKNFVDREFNDGHFRITLPRACGVPRDQYTYGPVRLYSFWHGVYVAALVDSALRKTIAVGDEILRIDHQNVKGLPQRAVDSMMYRRIGDSVTLSVIRNGEERDLNIRYTNAKVNSAILPQHCEFKNFNGISYFRINNWDPQVLTRFLNHWSIVKDTKAIIIDLRSNSGGNNGSAMRLFSLFVSSPHVYSNFTYFNNPKLSESVVVKPHQTFRIPSKTPVVILADNKTSCASEEFIMGMRQLPNVKLMACSKTKGVLAERIDIRFPSGLKLSCDSIQPKITFGDSSIEMTGIYPDIWVMLTRVDDLYLYDDKLLQTAISYLQ